MGKPRPAPTVPEIKQMEFNELIVEQARLTGVLVDMDNRIHALNSEGQPTSRLRRSQQKYETALVAVSAEIANRYSTYPEDKRTMLFKLMANVVSYVKVILDDDPENEYDEEVWDRLRRAIDALEAL